MLSHSAGFLIYKSQTGKRLSGSELKSTRWIADSGVYRSPRVSIN